MYLPCSSSLCVIVCVDDFFVDPRLVPGANTSVVFVCVDLAEEDEH